jgi:type IV secretory pathway VirJ component
MRSILVALLASTAFGLSSSPASAAGRSSRAFEVPLRGKTITLEIYEPSTGTARGTILMGSGDVGWVGLATSMAADLSGQGFLVVGINVRQYLKAFTDGSAHLTTADVQGDFHAIAGVLRADGLLHAPVIASGVSEGAALAVLAGADPHNHSWLDGVITMGLPEVAELAWRWSDFTAWITKRDAAEPSFQAHDFVGGVAPLPLAMIQSKRDEYVPESDYRRLLEHAHEPKRLTLIDASNHRVTDKHPELRAAYAAAIAWIASVRAAQEHS